MGDFAMYQMYQVGNYVFVREENTIFKIIFRTYNSEKPHLPDFTLEKLIDQEKIFNIKHDKFEKIELNETLLLEMGFKIKEEFKRKLFYSGNLSIEQLRVYQGEDFITNVYQKDKLLLVDETLPQSSEIYHIYIVVNGIEKYFKINSVNSLQNFLVDNPNLTEINFEKIMLQKQRNK